MNIRNLFLSLLFLPIISIAQVCDVFISQVPYEILEDNLTYCLDAPENSNGAKELFFDAYSWPRNGSYDYSGASRDKYVVPALSVKAKNVVLNMNDVNIRNIASKTTSYIHAGLVARGASRETLSVSGGGRFEDFPIGILTTSVPSVTIENIEIVNAQLNAIHLEADSRSENQLATIKNNKVQNSNNIRFDDARYIAGIEINNFDQLVMENNAIDTIDSEAEAHRVSYGIKTKNNYSSVIDGNSIQGIAQPEVSSQAKGIYLTCNPPRNGNKTCDTEITNNYLQQESLGYGPSSVRYIRSQAIDIPSHGGPISVQHNRLVDYAMALEIGDSSRAYAHGVYSNNSVEIYQPYVQGNFPNIEEIFIVTNRIVDGGGNEIYIAGEGCDIGITELPFLIDEGNKTYCLAPPAGSRTLEFDRSSPGNDSLLTTFTGNRINHEAAITIEANNVILNMNNTTIANINQSSDPDYGEIGIYIPNKGTFRTATINGAGEIKDFSIGIYSEDTEQLFIDGVSIEAPQLAGIFAIKNSSEYLDQDTVLDVANTKVSNFSNKIYTEEVHLYGIGSTRDYALTNYSYNTIQNVNIAYSPTLVTEEQTVFFAGLTSDGSAQVEGNTVLNLVALNSGNLDFVPTGVVALCFGLGSCSTQLSENTLLQHAVKPHTVGMFIVGETETVTISANEFTNLERAISTQGGTTQISGSYDNNVVYRNAHYEDGTPVEIYPLSSDKLVDGGGNQIFVTP